MAEVEINYNGSTIASMNASGTKTLETAGKYCEDDIEVVYNKPTLSASYLGSNPVKIADYSAVTTYLSSTPFTTWTPSKTALNLNSASNAGTAVLDLANYDYCIVWTSEQGFAYNGSETNVLKPVKQTHCLVQSIYKNPSNLTNLQNGNYNANRCTTLFTGGLIDFYNTSGSHTMSFTTSVGIYPAATAATFSNSTSNTPTLTIKTPVFKILCHDTYFSTANAEKIDAASTYFKYWGELWRVDKDSTMLGVYKNIVNAYNS